MFLNEETKNYMYSQVLIKTKECFLSIDSFSIYKCFLSSFW